MEVFYSLLLGPVVSTLTGVSPGSCPTHKTYPTAQGGVGHIYTLCAVEGSKMSHNVPPDAIPVMLDVQKFYAQPRSFSSGSVGWYLGTKAELNGTRCQVSLSIVVIGSKPVTPTPAETKEVDMGGGVTLFVESADKPQNRRKGKKGTETPPKA